MLATIEHVALDLGLAVSRVSLSREVSCHHLLNFYGRIASQLRVPDSKMLGLARALSRKTVNNLLNSPIIQPGRYIHPLPTLVLEDYLLSTGEEQEMLYGDLTGTRLTMTELKRLHRLCRGEAMPRFETNFRATQHGSAYFGMMADAIALCGYKGWVLLIDEVELIGRLGKVSRLQAYRNLNWLLNWSEQPWHPEPPLSNASDELFSACPYPIYTVGVVASSLRNDVWFSGTNTPSAKNDRTQIPDLAAEKFGPKAAAEMKQFFETAISPQCPTIKPLDMNSLSNWLEQIVKLHGIAYDWDAHLDLHALIQAIGSQPIRTHIRATLESLDIAYTYRETFTPAVTHLIETSVEEEPGFYAEEEAGEESF
jgi:hypothetical protein